MNRLLDTLQHLRRPRSADDHARLERRWNWLDPRWRTARQVIGRMSVGCGATIGVMPACDFGCTGCYLGSQANATPPASLEAVKQQIDQLRPWLGRWGNLQITDGEVTLRRTDELIELIRYARSRRLLPMVMTHGETFRRRPGLLERLMREAGLEEVCFHVDLTQRGRDADFAHARSEAALRPLREQLAEMIRHARRETSRPLRAASTMTVTRDNLPEVGHVARWYLDNADAFRMLSFQPMAQVGRTRQGVHGVTADAVWQRLADAVTGPTGLSDIAPESIDDQHWWFGHPECTRILTGLVHHDRRQARRYAIFGPATDRARHALVEGYARSGGVAPRHDQSRVFAARLLGSIARAPAMLWAGPVVAGQVLRQLGAGRPGRLVYRLIRRRAALRTFTFVTHAFMSADELNTPLGRERADQCVFRVPIDGELVSMCRVNADGHRDRVYDQLAGRDPDRPTPTPQAVALTVNGGQA